MNTWQWNLCNCCPFNTLLHTSSIQNVAVLLHILHYSPWFALEIAGFEWPLVCSFKPNWQTPKNSKIWKNKISQWKNHISTKNFTEKWVNYSGLCNHPMWLKCLPYKRELGQLLYRCIFMHWSKLHLSSMVMCHNWNCLHFNPQRVNGVCGSQRTRTQLQEQMPQFTW